MLLKVNVTKAAELREIMILLVLSRTALLQVTLKSGHFNVLLMFDNSISGQFTKTLL